MLEKLVVHKFMDKMFLEMWSIVNDPSEVLITIKNTTDWNRDASNFAINK
jgi:hypothetical protein